jgi:hypothetical protein
MKSGCDGLSAFHRLSLRLVMNSAGFRYTADQRAVISANAPKELNDGDWCELETLAVAYQCEFSHSRKILDKKGARQIEKTARKLVRQLKEIPSAEGVPPALSVSLKALSDTYAWLKLQQLPKSKWKRSNRARPDALDSYLAQLVQFYIRCGGRAGKAPSSRCARFVVAAASPVLGGAYFKMAPSAIAHLIRGRLWAQDLVTGRPEIGTPTLTINKPDCV